MSGGDRVEPTAVMLSYYFPPLVGIASERAAAFARHLPEHGWRPVVVAPRGGHFHREPGKDGAGVARGADIPPAGHPESPGSAPRVVRTRNPEMSRMLRAVWSRSTGGPDPDPDASSVAPVTVGSAGARLRELVRRYVYVPDAQIGWVPFAARALHREVRRLRAAKASPVLFSSSVPYSAHVAAALTARRLGVPWVAEFRDSWTTRPGRAMGHFRENVDRHIERDLVRVADQVVVTSLAARESLLRSHETLRPDRVHLVRNGFEPLPPGTPPGPGEPMRLVYMGTLYDSDHALPLVRALAALNGRADAAVVELEVFGPPTPWDPVRTAVADPSWLVLHGMRSPAEARSALTSASAAVLLHPTELHRDTLPGKLFEYLGARRPIVAAVPPGSEMQELLDAHGEGWYMEPYGIREARAVLEALLSRHREGGLEAPVVVEDVVAPLSRRAQTAALARVLEMAGT